jgi:hypothetical protein
MNNDQYGPDETEQRLEKLLQGAFAGAPTPLKEIPKKSGVERAPRGEKTQEPRRRRQRKNRAA